MPEPQTAGDHEPTCDLSVVVPVYKEEANIAPFLERMESVLKNLGGSYEIIFCLDPSPDRTEEVILEEINRDPRIKLVVFSRRFGQPSATMAGLLLCKGAACVVIDVDLQDPPELIPELYTRLRQGYEVVYAKRHSRKGETVVKRIVSKFGYWVIARLSDVQIPRDTGDFRIMTRRVIEELRALNESHGFLRGLVAYVGFKQTFVEYERDVARRAREAAEMPARRHAADEHAFVAGVGLHAKAISQHGAAGERTRRIDGNDTN